MNLFLRHNQAQNGWRLRVGNVRDLGRFFICPLLMGWLSYEFLVFSCEL